MLDAIVLLIISAALSMFYLQAHCQRILWRQFGHELFLGVINANRLGFPFVRKALEELEVPVDYPSVRMRLMSDFLALTYLLKVTCKQRRRWLDEERLLAARFRATFVVLITTHWLGLNERPAVLKLTSILEYLANVLFERRPWRAELDVMVEGNGTVFLVCPLSDAAREWLDINMLRNTQRLGDIRFVEPRHLDDLIGAMLDRGLWVVFSLPHKAGMSWQTVARRG
jgi:hypothetical protein